MDNLITALDNLLALRDKATARAIDAGACGTSRDHAAARKAADALDDARDAFVAAVRTEIAAERAVLADEIVTSGARLAVVTRALAAIVHAPNLDVAIDAIKAARAVVPGQPLTAAPRWTPGSTRGGEG